MPFVYILQCNDRTYYTGYAVNLERRLLEHQQGIGCKYTRGRLPVELVYWEEFENKSQAMQKEYQIKQLTKAAKMVIIKNFKCQLIAKDSSPEQI